MSPRLRKARKVVTGLVLVLAVFVAAVWLTRASWLPGAIARAPNAGKTVERLGRAAPAHKGPSGTRDLRVDVGPPASSLSLRVVDPATSPPRGTVFVLHGIRDDKRSMAGVGEALADAGYRAVLVDARGQGQSTGEWLSYGAREGRDLVQVADALAAQGLLARPLGVYGPSYGGAVALQFARRDPRIRAVVAVATFTRMRDVVPLYGERILPSWFITRDDVRRAIDRVGVLGEFRPDDADSVAAIGVTNGQVLLVHGRADANIPWEHSQTLHDAALGHSRLLVVDGKDHRTIMSDATVMRESLAWFDRWLVAGERSD
jgi:pimeloyl-ACP methyl ester carboxylesterase